MASVLQQQGRLTSAHGMEIQVEAVSKRYGDTEVLRNVTLTVQPGEFVALVGRSGVGKSTLLRLIGGLEEPFAGTIRLDGAQWDGLHPQIRVMFQDARLLPWRRTWQNVVFGRGGRSGRADALAALESVGLADRADAWPATLSGGQKQRVALARALLSRPRLLLLDEPLGALDALTRLQMQELIAELWRTHGFTAVLVTHDVDEALRLANRIIILKEGRIDQDLPVPDYLHTRLEHPEYLQLRQRVLRHLFEQ